MSKKNIARYFKKERMTGKHYLFTEYAIKTKGRKFPDSFALFTQIKVIFAAQNPERRMKWSK